MSNSNDTKEEHIPTESELKEGYNKLIQRAIISLILIPVIAFFYFVIYIPSRVGGTTNELLIFLMGIVVPLLVFAILAIIGIATVILFVAALQIKKKIKSKEFI